MCVIGREGDGREGHGEALAMALSEFPSQAGSPSAETTVAAVQHGKEKGGDVLLAKRGSCGHVCACAGFASEDGIEARRF